MHCITRLSHGELSILCSLPSSLADLLEKVKHPCNAWPTYHLCMWCVCVRACVVKYLHCVPAFSYGCHLHTYLGVTVPHLPAPCLSPCRPVWCTKLREKGISTSSIKSSLEDQTMFSVSVPAEVGLPPVSHIPVVGSIPTLRNAALETGLQCLPLPQPQWMHMCKHD